MNENEKRLETALLEFIERVAKEPKSGTETEIEILPLMAQALITLWGNH